jgi:hypothetical protein
VSADGDRGHVRIGARGLRAASSCNPAAADASDVLRGCHPGTAMVEGRKEADMPAKTEKQRKFMGAELERKREGKKTRTNMSEKELEKMASKGGSKKKS